MDHWDESAADAAVAGLARTAGLNEIFEILFRYGARDFRDIGHKAIFVANSLRTLNLIGQQHAEPVLRSLAYALLEHEGGNPAGRDDAGRHSLAAQRRPGEATSRRLDRRQRWTTAPRWKCWPRCGRRTKHESCDKVVEIINRGVHPQAIWDALLVGAGELLARQPGIVALHAVTTSNALRYAWNTSASDDTRRMLLLQNAAFVPMFRQAMISRGGKLKELKLDELQPVSLAGGERPAVDEIFADVSGDKMQAAGKILTYLQAHPDPTELVDAARLLVFLKGTNAHDYKFSSAVLEDYNNVSPKWRDAYLASGVFNLRGSGGNDNALVARTRAALA